MPTILTKKSDTPGSVPATGNLTNAAGGAELAINTADKRLFTISSGSQVVEVGTNPSSLTCADGSFTLLKAASASITNLTATSLVLSNLSIASANITTLTSASATVTNLLATSLTVSSGSTLNGGVVINEPGADADTRIEGDTDANLVFVDASADKVGIGTSSPLGKLGIAGSATATIIIPRSSNGSTASPVETQLIGSTFTNGTFEAGVYALNSFLNTSANWLAFKTTDAGNTTATRMVLDQSGNLGLGVTPSAWNSSIKAFQISDATILAAGGQGQPVLIFNGFVNSAGDFKYLTNNFASRYEQVSGQHQWYTAASGTAGNTITFTQAMTLDASGNLGVGTTSPSGRLHVATSSGNCYVYSARASKSTGQVAFQLSGGTSGTDWIIYQDTNSDDLKFFGNSAERARITSGGDLLVGTTTSQAKLTVDGYLSHKGTYGRQGTSGSPGQGNLINFFWNSSAQIEAWIDTSNVGNVTLSSDYRIKKNVVTQTENALDRIAKLRPVVYELADYGALVKADGVRREGFIAHEVQDVIPSGAEGEKDEENRIQNLRVDAILAVAVKAIQELSAKVAALEAK